ncbi:LytTR family DNA-binding domain-containing protein [Maricaulis sp.]|uniref:LytTR family DNA-binding domain-containing protein n=1 Tax=Maricaulis sp. TaxID=1486257 RepID=UPI00261F5697|nr:LytTR family DNA-binding domain-containing protein [Maricaulis sp.]
MSKFLQACPSRRVLLQTGLLVLALSLIQTASGGFDSDDVSFAHRLVLWTVVVCLVAGQFLAIMVLVRLSGLAQAGRRWPAWLIAFAGVWPLVTLQVEALKRTPLLSYQAPDPLLDFALFMAPGIAFICGLIVLIEIQAERQRRREDEQASWVPAPLEDADPGEGWPAGTILSIETQDHYLSLTSDHGQHLVRATMSEAIARTRPGSGMRVHRSWWVAREAVARTERRGRDHVLILVDDRVVPIARGRVDQLKQAGWL